MPNDGTENTVAACWYWTSEIAYSRELIERIVYRIWQQLNHTARKAVKQNWKFQCLSRTKCTTSCLKESTAAYSRISTTHKPMKEGVEE